MEEEYRTSLNIFKEENKINWVIEWIKRRFWLKQKINKFFNNVDDIQEKYANNLVNNKKKN